MFNSSNTESTNNNNLPAKVQYTFKVENVRKTKNDKLLIIDLDINGVKVYSCFFKEITVQKDGKKYKAGDTTYVIQFPQEKSSNGKYYDRVWCPVSNENMNSIIDQIKALLG